MPMEHKLSLNQQLICRTGMFWFQESSMSEGKMNEEL